MSERHEAAPAPASSPRQPAGPPSSNAETRLLLCFASLFMLLIGMGLYEIHETAELAELIEELHHHPLAVSSSIREIRAHVNTMRDSMKDVAVARTDQQLGAALQSVAAEEKLALDHFDVLQERYHGEKDHIISLRSDFLAWRAIRDEVAGHAKKGERERAQDITRGKGADHVAALVASMDRVSRFADRKGDELHEKATSEKAQSLTNMWLVLATSALLATFVGYIIIKSIAQRRRAREQFGQEARMREILLDSLPCIAMIIKKGTREIVASNEAARAVGAVPGKTCHETYAQRDDSCPFCLAPEVWDIGETKRLEVEYRGAYCEAIWVPLTGDTYVHYISDITERKRTEEKLRELLSMIEQSSESIMRTDVDFRIDFMNRGAEELFGWTLEELRGKTPGFVNAEPVADEIQKAIYETVAAGKQYDSKALNRRKDGSTFVCHFRVAPILDADGSIVGYMGSQRDATQEEQAKQALARSEESYRAVFDGAAEGILVADAETRSFLFANPAACGMLGYSADELKGMGVLDIHPEDVLEHVILEFEAQVRGEKWLSADIPCLRNDGTVFYADFSSKVAKIDGTLCNVGFLTDVTGRRRAAEVLRETEAHLMQAQKMEAVGTLAGGIAHDFNNLLTGILGHAEMLKRWSESDDRTREAAATIETAALRAAELTSQLLGFARKGKLRNEPFELEELVLEVTSLLRRTLNRNIEIDAEFRAISSTVRGDSGQLEQVLMNLSLNAKDAMPGGGQLGFLTDVVLLDEPSAETLGTESGLYVKVAVTDSGRGIPEEDQARIFEPFFTTKGPAAGTGMGLAMVYGIVKNHDGCIAVQSEVGKGTTFEVYLPAIFAEADKVAAQAEEKIITGSGKILLVDDEEAVREVAAMMLAQLGYEVEVASDGGEGLRVYEEARERYDLVVLDMIMPGMGGGECFRALRQIDPDVKVLLCSGHDVEGEASKLMSEGLAGAVRKPYMLRELGRAVASAMAAEDEQ